MSKKKNTLKDLDEFLKQQAATLVSPSKLSEKVSEDPEPVRESPSAPVSSSTEISPGKILHDLQWLAKNDKNAFRKDFYDLIIQSIESQDQSLPEDKMLINTAIYLKSGQRWKEAIRDYWKSRGQ
jgi:hypothetical protein